MPRTRAVVLSGDRAIASALVAAAERAACVAALVTPEWELAAVVTGFRPDLIVVDCDSLGTDPLTLLERNAHHIGAAPLVLRSTRCPRLMSKLLTHLRELGLTVEAMVGEADPAPGVEAAITQFQSRATRITAAELANAMSQNELVVHYQPKVRLASPRPLVGAEALIRWRHPTLGLIGAGQVVSLAERSRQHWRLTEWVLDKALDLLGLAEDLGMEIRVAVNVPADFIAEPHFNRMVADALERHDAAPSSLCLEITETTAMREGPAITRALTTLRLRGVHLSIDDFGTGYSSLIQLHRLPFDELKIDQSFIRDFPQSQASCAIVASTLSLCERLGLQVCAEGIETNAAADELERLGCQIGQGYLFGKPMPAREFIQACRKTADTPRQGSPLAEPAAEPTSQAA